MSQRVCQTLTDLVGHGGCMVARCKPCRRVVIFSIHGLIDHFKKRSWSTEFRSVKARIVCSKCGERPSTFAYYQGKSPAMPPMMSVEVHPPAGIDPVEWYMASHDGRKRLIRQARG